MIIGWCKYKCTDCLQAADNVDITCIIQVIIQDRDQMKQAVYL